MTLHIDPLTFAVLLEHWQELALLGLILLPWKRP